MKRALRSFGAQFGNSLYGDGETFAPASGAEQALAPSLRKALLGLGASQGFGEQQVRKAVWSKTGKEPGELPTSDLTRMVEGAAAKLQQAGVAAAARPSSQRSLESRERCHRHDSPGSAYSLSSRRE